MKIRISTLCSAVALMLLMMAGQPEETQARDNVFVGADLGGLFVHYDNYPRRAWAPPPPPRPVYWDGGRRPVVVYEEPPPPRYWHRRHRHHYYSPPPRPDYYEYRQYRRW